jgi:hypothetical protein
MDRSPSFSTSPARWRLGRPEAIWRLAEEKLGAYGEILLAAVIMSVIGIAALILFQAVRLIGASGGTAPEGAISLKVEVRETPFPKTAYRAAPAEKAEGAPADLAKVGPPRIEWSTVEDRRRAASLLCLIDDPGAAASLLLPDDPDREDLRKVTASLSGAVLEALGALLPVEEEKARACVERAAGTAAVSILPAAQEAPSPEGRAARLRRWGEVLPDAVLHSFAVNLHCAIRDRSGASDAHLRVLLESLFPPRSPARKVYLDTRSPVPVPYRGGPEPTR